MMKFLRLKLCILLAGLCVQVCAQQKITLENAIRQAKASNPYLKTASYNIDVAKTDIITAGLKLNPVLNNQSLQLVNSKYFAENTSALNAHNRQVWWQLTKPFRLNGQRTNQIDFAEKNTDLEKKNYEELKRLVSSEVAGKWLQVWMMQEKLDLLSQAQLNVDSLIKVTEVRLRNLAVASVDLLRIRILSEQLTLQIRSTRNDYIADLKNLKLSMGTVDSVVIDASDTSQFDLSKKLNLDSLQLSALQWRTDYRTAQSSLLVTESNIKLQRSLAYPVPELGLIWNPQNTVPYLGFFGTLELPLFSRNQGEREKSLVLKKQAEQNVQSTEKVIQKEVAIAFNKYKTESENLKRYNTILSQTETVLNTVRYAYLRGGTTIIDLLEAQRTWLDTRQLYMDALYAYRQSSLELLTATGLITQLYE